MKKALPYLSALLSILFISLSPIFVRLSEVDPLATAFFRFFIAFPFIWGLFSYDHIKKGGSHLPESLLDLLLLLCAGLAYGFAIAFMFRSYMDTSLANAVFISNLMPVIVPFVAYIFIKEKLNISTMVGIGIVIVGMLIFLAADVHGEKGSYWGNLEALFSAFCLSIWLVIIKVLREKYSSIMISMWYILTSIYVCSIITFSMESHILPQTFGAWEIVLLNAILVQVLGIGFYTYSLKNLGATESSLMLSFVPVIATALGWIIFKEDLTLSKAIGAVIIFLGVLYADLKSKFPKHIHPRQF